MIVAELIVKLKECDPDDVVVLSSDGVGNSCWPIISVEKYIYVPAWREIYLREFEEGYDEEDLYHGDDGVNAVVLSPV